MISKEELCVYVEQEIQWLKYYAHRDGRNILNTESDIYDTLKTIGKTKCITPLYSRCAACIIKLSEMEIVPLNRDVDKGQFTALEVYWMIYPDERQMIVDKLKD
jgi:hypothetical protein